MKLIFDHVFGKQEHQDLVVCNPLAEVMEEEENEAIESGWLALDVPIKGTEVFYQSRSTRIDLEKFKPRFSSHKLNGKDLKVKEIEANDMVKLVGLDGRENYFPRELSGGQQQRVGIARSLAVEPDIWFLDEPFSALDPLIRKEMQDEFLRLQGVLKKTIMFITHDFDEALRLADRIAIMKDGLIEQLDTPAKIVLNPATEYVRKFTEEVPREKVLKIESVMEPMSDNKNLSDLKVSKEAIIETVAEKILSQEKPVAVIDSNKKVVGIVKPSKVIHTVFGGRNENS